MTLRGSSTGSSSTPTASSSSPTTRPARCRRRCTRTPGSRACTSTRSCASGCSVGAPPRCSCTSCRSRRRSSPRPSAQSVSRRRAQDDRGVERDRAGVRPRRLPAPPRSPVRLLHVQALLPRLRRRPGAGGRAAGPRHDDRDRAPAARPGRRSLTLLVALASLAAPARARRHGAEETPAPVGGWQLSSPPGRARFARRSRTRPAARGRGNPGPCRRTGSFLAALLVALASLAAPHAGTGPGKPRPCRRCAQFFLSSCTLIGSLCGRASA